MTISNTALADVANSYLFTDSDNAEVKAAVKASSTTIYAIDVDNSANAAATFTKLWNVASGSVTVGTTAPDMIILAPANTRVGIPIPQGLAFGTALTIASLTTAGTAGTTGPTSDVIVRIVYV